MKQGISPAAAIATIVVVVIVIGAIGYFAVIKPNADDQDVHENQDEMMKKAMEAGMKAEGQKKAGGAAAPQ
ncbi:MAG TPA: hypothetical protein QGH10_03075 [Armatimonadota bacterium]|nr:hypothetical protein [Armatimonadota bacterium]